jgi:hypothetical protein
MTMPQTQTRRTMKVDPDEMIEIMKEMARVMEVKGPEEQTYLDNTDMELFATILECKESHVKLLKIIEGHLSLCLSVFMV